MRNLMQPEALKLVAYIAGIIASPAVILAAVKAILFFGKLSNAVDRLIDFAEHATERLGNHDTRIAVLEDRAGVPR